MNDELSDMGAARTAAAQDLDATADQAFGAAAAQFAKVSPEAGQMVLDPLKALIGSMGAQFEAQSLADPVVARALGAVADATQDAAAQDVIAPDLAFEASDLVDDGSAKVLAGKLSMLAKNKPFLKWLKSPVEAPKAAPKPKAAPAAKDTTAEDDALMQSRA